jgi:hypothetical protein
LHALYHSDDVLANLAAGSRDERGESRDELLMLMAIVTKNADLEHDFGTRYVTNHYISITCLNLAW